MAFGEDFLKGFFGSDFLKDYTHASKTFRSDNGALAPRRKFLFHVVFNLNVQQIPQRTSSSSSESYAGGAPDGTGSPTVAIFFSVAKVLFSTIYSVDHIKCVQDF